MSRRLWIRLLGLSVAVLLLTFAQGCAPSDTPVDPSGPMPLETPTDFGAPQAMPVDNPITYEGFELGKRLFYDPKLSRNGTVSCASCHQQALAFTDGKALSTGIDGQIVPRSSMSLANMRWQNRFHWDGAFASLEAQALAPITNPLEMGNTLEGVVNYLQNQPDYRSRFAQTFGTNQVTPDLIAKALSQFTRMLVSHHSKYDRWLRGEVTLTAEEERGRVLFFTHPIPEIGLRGANCSDCHAGHLQQGVARLFDGFHNNGLDPDARLKPGLRQVTGLAADQGKFKAPSLRNIALTAPYMHDGRFATLEAVLEHYDQHIQMSATLDPLIIEASNQVRRPGDPVKLYLSPDEKRAVIAFLRTLTDEQFVRDPRFANPF